MLPGNLLTKMQADLYRLLRKCPVKDSKSARVLTVSDHCFKYYHHTVKITRAYFYCCGKKFPRRRPREILDHLFRPLEPAPELISIVDLLLPLPIAEEIIPHLPALPARCYLDELVADL